MQILHKTAELDRIAEKLKEEADTIILLRDGNVIYFGNICREDAECNHKDGG